MVSTDLLQRLVTGDIDSSTAFVVVGREGAMAANTALGPVALLPGAFNPVHAGHLGLAAAAAEQIGREVLFELSVVNVDKPPLSAAAVRVRLAQFRGRARVVLTRAPRFVDKARTVPGCVFVLGWDTFARLLDARYYDNDEYEMRRALAEIRELGCRFLVAGRAVTGVFHALGDADVPAEFAELFAAIPEERFRLDISSTALRGG